MPKLIIRQPFPVKLTRNDYAIIPVVDGEGRIKVLKIKPGNEHGAWFQPEWARDNAGRVTGLISVSLTTEREEAGCFFLQHAYEEERFPEGWREYQRYLAAQYTRRVIDERGQETFVRRQKPLEADTAFPDELLPDKVMALRGKRRQGAVVEFKPDLSVAKKGRKKAEPKTEGTL